MTDEEMAEERAIKFTDINFNEPDNYGTEKEVGHFSYHAGFLAGLEAGRLNRMTKQFCVRTYEDYCNDLNTYLKKGWRVIVVTPRPKYNEYILEKEVKDGEAEDDGYIT